MGKVARSERLRPGFALSCILLQCTDPGRPLPPAAPLRRAGGRRGKGGCWSCPYWFPGDLPGCPRLHPPPSTRVPRLPPFPLPLVLTQDAETLPTAAGRLPHPGPAPSSPRRRRRPGTAPRHCTGSPPLGCSSSRVLVLSSFPLEPTFCSLLALRGEASSPDLTCPSPPAQPLPYHQGPPLCLRATRPRLVNICTV